MDFTGKHILVTGASTGIGRSTVERVHRAGATVSMIARSADKLEAMQQQLGERALWTAADVGDPAQLAAAIDAAVEQAGPIDGLFANAGISGNFCPLEAYSDEAYEELMAINQHAHFRTVRHVFGAMKARGSGSIVITGSLASERGMAMNVAYVMSKHAMLGLSRAAAMEGAAHGVRVNCLVPGFIDTPLMDGIPPEQLVHLAANVPQNRLGSSAETANVVAFLLSDEASHVTGQSWAVDGGVLGTLAVR